MPKRSKRAGRSGESPSRWVESRRTDEALRDLRADLDDLDGTLRIIWRFFIDSLWSKIEELRLDEARARIPVPPRRHRPAKVDVGTIEIREGLSFETLKRVYFLRELERHGGNLSATASSLGLNVKTLSRMVARWRDADTKAGLSRGAAEREEATGGGAEDPGREDGRG